MVRWPRVKTWALMQVEGTKMFRDEDQVEGMKNWILPLTVFGMGSLGVLALSDKGLEVMRWAVQRLSEAPVRFVEWNEAAQHELDRLQKALNEMATTLEA